MAWLSTNLPLILACLSGSGLILGLVCPQLPPGKLRKVVLALAHLLPGDVAQAIGKLATPKPDAVTAAANAVKS